MESRPDQVLPQIALTETDSATICAAFEQLAKLAGPNLYEWMRNLAGSHVEHYRTIFGYVHRLRAVDSIETLLDVGAVPGFISVTLKRNGLDVQAVDLDPGRAQGIFDSAGVSCHRVDIEKESLPLESDSFDVVLFNEVIEHLRINPLLPLREIHRVLRVGGYLVLSTPNITLPMRLRFVLGTDYQDDIVNEFKKLETVGHMGHFRLFSRTEIARLLAHLGFEIISSRAHTVTTHRMSLMRRVLEKLAPDTVGDHLYVVAKKCA